MTVQAVHNDEAPSTWARIVENVPTDPASITVYIMMAIFAYVLWRNASWK